MDKRGDLRGDLFRNKKGQFFLIAALVIVVIILGLASIQVSTKVSKENVRIYDLTNEIDLEGKSVVDHGVFTDKTPVQIEVYIKELLSYYVETNPDSNFAIVYGDTEGYDIIKSGETSSTESCTPAGCFKQTITGITSEPGNCPPEGECIVEVSVPESTEPVEFILREGQNFFIVAGETDEATGAATVITNSKPSF